MNSELWLSILPTRGGWTEGSHGARSALLQREDAMGYGPDRTPSATLSTVDERLELARRGEPVVERAPAPCRRSSPPAGASRRRTRRSGSCARPAATCPSTGRCARSTTSSTMARTPELAAEVTLQPVRRFALDAAILFSDILTPLDGLGLGLEFHPAPVVDAARCGRRRRSTRSPGRPPRRPSPFVFETIRGLRARAAGADAAHRLRRRAVHARTATWSRASGSKGFFAAKSFLFAEPERPRRLLDKLADLTIAYLAAQARAGAQALMLFDSWAGLLGPRPTRAIRAAGRPRGCSTALAPLGLPRIYFPQPGRDAARPAARPAASTSSASTGGCRCRAPAPSSARRSRVQGNLDPAALFAPPAELVRLGRPGARRGRAARLGTSSTSVTASSR